MPRHQNNKLDLKVEPLKTQITFLKGKFILEKMAENAPEIICTFELENGYIIKNFFNINSIRGRPTITILSDKIRAINTTADGEIYAKSYLHGDEVGLTWNLPPEKRQLNLSFDASQNNVTFNRIKKKDEARITIAQTQHNPNFLDFDGPDSSDEFVIYVSCGGGGDRREGLQRIAARRVEDQPELLIYEPSPVNSDLLIIPIKTFCQMMDSFSKCKKQSVRLCFYPNTTIHEGIKYSGKPGIMITTDMIGGGKSGAILEKYGEIPDEELVMPTFKTAPINIDEQSIVKLCSSKLIIEEEKELEPNEFVFGADKIGIFTKLAHMHNEGTVRIYYQEGHHLRMALRFGGFGECEIFLSNEYVAIA